MADSPREKLKQLRETYAGQLPGKIGQIGEALDGLRLSGEDPGAVEGLIRMAHTLAGSAPSFGFTAVGKSARVMESLLKDFAKGGCSADELCEKAGRCIEEMKHLCDDLRPAAGDAPAGWAVPQDGDRGRKTIFLVEDDPLLSQSMALQISHFGYHAENFTALSELEGALLHTSPSAIIMDMMFPEGDLAGAKAIARIQRGRSSPLPVIFISNRGDLNARLQAVRAGGNAYFTKPVDIAGLVDRLDALTDGEVVNPFRILIVDDDPELANYYSLVLQENGMDTLVAEDPLEIMRYMVEFNPDLILMDMYMPQCAGYELAKVIRQMEAYISVPIVFLSAETDINKQLSAMSTGGDEFLTKPIEPRHLISSVSTRAERMRIIRSFMECDSLTGLLNHTKTKEYLDKEISRAVRQGSVLAFAMLDIDRFKSVNDTYGHPAGDRVIVSLSRLLQQRLRNTDIIGRYGGEEFAIVLAGADEESAAKVVDEIRLSFGQIRHNYDGAEFSATFSCGVAGFPRYGDVISLCDAADKALYEAKHKGRNRIMLAQEQENR